MIKENLNKIKSLSRLGNPFPAMPSYLLLFVTSKCDASCGHCFFWRRTNRADKELTLAEITKLSKKLGPLVQLTLTGGSPELRDDLPLIAGILYKNNSPINVTLCSNGNYPDRTPEMVKQILTDSPDMNLTVDISIDALYEEHDKLRNLPGLFERAVESFKNLAELKSEFPRLRLGCGICVSGLNSDSALNTAKWILDNLPVDNLTPILVRGETRNKKALNVNSQVFSEIAEMVQAKLLSNSLDGYSAFPEIVNAKDILQKQLIFDIFKNGTMPVRCSAGREVAVIYPDGTVPGCEIRSEILGNLRDVDMDLAKIWYSEKNREFRQKINAEKCSCWHQCFLSPSMIKSPKLWPKLASTVVELKKKKNNHV